MSYPIIDNTVQLNSIETTVNDTNTKVDSISGGGGASASGNSINIVAPSNLDKGDIIGETDLGITSIFGNDKIISNPAETEITNYFDYDINDTSNAIASVSLDDNHIMTVFQAISDNKLVFYISAVSDNNTITNSVAQTYSTVITEDIADLKIEKLSATHYCVVWKENNEDNDNNGILIISLDTIGLKGIITFGTHSVILSGAFIHNNRAFDLQVLDGTHILLAYEKTAGTGFIKCGVVDTGALSVSYGGEVALPGFTGDYLTVIPFSATEFVVSYKGTSNYPASVVGTLATSTITLGSETRMNTIDAWVATNQMKGLSLNSTTILSAFTSSTAPIGSKLAFLVGTIIFGSTRTIVYKEPSNSTVFTSTTNTYLNMGKMNTYGGFWVSCVNGGFDKSLIFLGNVNTISGEVQLNSNGNPNQNKYRIIESAITEGSQLNSNYMNNILVSTFINSASKNRMRINRNLDYLEYGKGPIIMNEQISTVASIQETFVCYGKSARDYSTSWGLGIVGWIDSSTKLQVRPFATLTAGDTFQSWGTQTAVDTVDVNYEPQIIWLSGDGTYQYYVTVYHQSDTHGWASVIRIQNNNRAIVIGTPKEIGYSISEQYVSRLDDTHFVVSYQNTGKLTTTHCSVSGQTITNDSYEYVSGTADASGVTHTGILGLSPTKAITTYTYSNAPKILSLSLTGSDFVQQNAYTISLPGTPSTTRFPQLIWISDTYFLAVWSMYGDEANMGAYSTYYNWGIMGKLNSDDTITFGTGGLVTNGYSSEKNNFVKCGYNKIAYNVDGNYYYADAGVLDCDLDTLSWTNIKTHRNYLDVRSGSSDNKRFGLASDGAGLILMASFEYDGSATYGKLLTRRLSMDQDDPPIEYTGDLDVSFTIPHTALSSTDLTDYRIVALSSTKFAVFYTTATQGIIVIGTYDADTGIALGTPVVVNNAVTNTLSIVKVDDTHVCLGYKDEGGDDGGKMAVGTVTLSTNTIVLGTEAEFNSGATEYISLTRISDTSLVVAYQDAGGDTYANCKKATISEDVLSFGAEQAITSSLTKYIDICTYDSTHIAVVYQDDGGSDYGKLVIGTLGEDDLITFGSETTIKSTICSYLRVQKGQDGMLLIAYYDGTNTIYEIASVTVSAAYVLALLTASVQPLHKYESEGSSAGYISLEVNYPSNFTVSVALDKYYNADYKSTTNTVENISLISGKINNSDLINLYQEKPVFSSSALYRSYSNLATPIDLCYMNDNTILSQTAFNNYLFVEKISKEIIGTILPTNSTNNLYGFNTSVSDVEIGTTNGLGSGSSDYMITPFLIEPNTIIVIYQDNSDKFGKAVAGTMDTTNNTITWGDEFTWFSEAIYTNNLRVVQDPKNPEYFYMLFRLNATETMYIKALQYDVGLSSFVIGEDNILPSITGTTTANVTGGFLFHPTDDYGVLFYRDTSMNSSLIFKSFTVNGLDITVSENYGTTRINYSSDNEEGYSWLDNNKIFISSTYYYGGYAVIDPTDFSDHIFEMKWNGSDALSYTHTIRLQDGLQLLLYKFNTGSNVYVRTVTYKNNMIELGTPLLILSGVNSYLNGIRLTDNVAQINLTNSSTKLTTYYTIEINPITSEARIIDGPYNTTDSTGTGSYDFDKVIYNDASKKWLAFEFSKDRVSSIPLGPVGTKKYNQINDILGVSTATVAKDATASILIDGVSSFGDFIGIDKDQVKYINFQGKELTIDDTNNESNRGKYINNQVVIKKDIDESRDSLEDLSTAVAALPTTADISSNDPTRQSHVYGENLTTGDIVQLYSDEGQTKIKEISEGGVLASHQVTVSESPAVTIGGGVGYDWENDIILAIYCDSNESKKIYCKAGKPTSTISIDWGERYLMHTPPATTHSDHQFKTIFHEESGRFLCFSSVYYMYLFSVSVNPDTLACSIWNLSVGTTPFSTHLSFEYDSLKDMYFCSYVDGTNTRGVGLANPTNGLPTKAYSPISMKATSKNSTSSLDTLKSKVILFDSDSSSNAVRMGVYNIGKSSASEIAIIGSHVEIGIDSSYPMASYYDSLTDNHFLFVKNADDSHRGYVYTVKIIENVPVVMDRFIFNSTTTSRSKYCDASIVRLSDTKLRFSTSINTSQIYSFDFNIDLIAGALTAPVSSTYTSVAGDYFWETCKTKYGSLDHNASSGLYPQVRTMSADGAEKSYGVITSSGVIDSNKPITILGIPGGTITGLKDLNPGEKYYIDKDDRTIKTKTSEYSVGIAISTSTILILENYFTKI